MTSYDQIYSGFEHLAPEKFNFARDVIDRWAAKDSNLNAVFWIDDSGANVTLTYADLARRSQRVANALASRGVKRGDVVLVMLGRQLAWWETVTACLRAGFVVAPATTQLSEKDIDYRINAASAKAIVADETSAEKVDAVAKKHSSLNTRLIVGATRGGWVEFDDARDAASDQFDSADTNITDDAICYFTSGTTGYPKMVVHSQGYGLAHKVTGKYWLDLSERDLHWNISDTGWAKAAWSSYFGPFNQGASIFVHHTGGFDPVKTLELLQNYPVTTMCAAPTIYRMLVQQDLSACDLSSLRHCVGAGEPLNPEVIEVWRNATGVTIRDGYGQTESVILCGAFPFVDVKTGSMGKPAPGVSLSIVDDGGIICAPEVEGNLAVRVKPERPLGLFDRYRGDDNANSSSFAGDWYFTGDRAYCDKDGYFWFVGRADDVIISSGYRIGPFEVESALVEHPAVVESAVVSSPDPVRGEVVKAFVILAPGFTGSGALARELQNYVKSVTAPYKYPRKIEFVATLPKTVSGKIRRAELRKAEWSGRSSA